MEARSWHSLPLDVVLEETGGGVAGLSEGEARARLARLGPNRLTVRRGPSWVKKLAEQFLAPLVLVLLLAAALSLALGDFVDAAVIAAVVLVNGVIGFFQEFRAEQSISALSANILTEATVVRDGRQRRVPSEELVFGDLVLLQSGDGVPADLRLVEVKDLRVEEAALTGESVPSEKSVEVLSAETPVGDRSNLAFAGSAVTYGQAKGVVVATGDATEAGKIAHLMAETVTLETPLTRRIARLSKFIVGVVFVLAALLFGIETLRGASWTDTFNAAIALAVGMIPEGLPAAVTILLAIGVSSMARRGALVRRLPAVETLGSTTVVCSDKTGTLTQNEMTVTVLATQVDEVECTGTGFDGTGELLRGGAPVELASHAALHLGVTCAVVCNDARLVDGADGRKIEGDPTEGALLVLGEKARFDGTEWRRLDTLPFESQHMYMGVLAEGPAGRCLFVKGSSDALLERLRAALAPNGDELPLERDALEEKVRALAGRGLRVLLLAGRPAPETTAVNHADVRDLVFYGLVGMIDPPRVEAARAVRVCQDAGIRVKMITGDHAVTASAIAGELGLEGERAADGRLRALTGTELAKIPPEELPRLAEAVAVFARVAPEQKLHLVRALQSLGHVVAMTGDGVNDAPALKQADLGVAMGKNGTDVARSAAAMILTDDNFATIEAAVEEGRGIYDNLVKFLTWTLPTNGGEGLVLLTAVALERTLPVLPVQLLWLNLTTAIFGTALIFEPHEPGVMRDPPRSPSAPLLDGALLRRVGLVSLLVGAGAFGFFEWALATGASEAAGRTIAINTIVAIEVAYLFACRSLRLPLHRLGFFDNPGVLVGAAAMLGVQALFTYAPFMNVLFHTEPIDFVWWVRMTIAGLGAFVVAEVEKGLARR